MTAAQSPISVLRKQARATAEKLKLAASGKDTGIPDPDGRLAAAQKRGGVKFGIVMDDKILTMEMSWDVIRCTKVNDLAEFILGKMREPAPEETKH